MTMIIVIVITKYNKNKNIRVAIDKFTNKPKGFAHIDFINNSVAKQAAKELNEVFFPFLLL